MYIDSYIITYVYSQCYAHCDNIMNEYGCFICVRFFPLYYFLLLSISNQFNLAFVSFFIVSTTFFLPSEKHTSVSEVSSIFSACVCVCLSLVTSQPPVWILKKNKQTKTYIHSKLKPPRQNIMLLVWPSFKNNNFILSKSIKPVIHKGLLRVRHWGK